MSDTVVFWLIVMAFTGGILIGSVLVPFPRRRR